jgi:hypothetical protein
MHNYAIMPGGGREGWVGMAGPVWKYAEVAAISPRQGLYIQCSSPICLSRDEHRDSQVTIKY